MLQISLLNFLLDKSPSGFNFCSYNLLLGFRQKISNLFNHFKIFFIHPKKKEKVKLVLSFLSWVNGLHIHKGNGTMKPLAIALSGMGREWWKWRDGGGDRTNVQCKVFRQKCHNNINKIPKIK
jgi:hypothetical protein